MASAQTPLEETPPKFIFGPLGLTPRVEVREVGFDTNPLNMPGETERDFTFTVQPGLDSSLRMGRGRLSARSSVEYVHFNDAVSQRSWNFNQEARAEVTMNRLRPYAAGAYLRTRQRPTPEIDLRVQQNTTSATVGTSLLLGSRLRLDAEARRADYDFDDGEHGDAVIASALNRRADTVSLISRFTLTPLTTFVLRSDIQRDIFETSSVRDAQSFSVVPRFELKPSALISGTVSVGFRRFNPDADVVPDFSGVVGKIDTRYVWRESTLFAFLADRDVVYSIESEQPYYVQTGGQLSVIQTLGLNWYVVGRVGETRLAYREFVPELSGSAARPEDRVDRLLRRGGGVGRRLGEDIRIGFDVDYIRRRSSIALQEFEGYRVGGSISYGLQTR